jgi:hypothetical protein
LRSALDTPTIEAMAHGLYAQRGCLP